MKILYLTYGKQSNVVKFLSENLRKRGAEVEIFNVASTLRYRHPRYKLPSLHPRNLINTFLAVLFFRKYWKMFFLRTTYAFYLMTKIAEKHIARGNYDIILQSGVIFSPSFKGLDIPYFPYIDHTYAISKKYSPVPGLPDYSICGGKKWEEWERETYRRASLIFTMSNFVKKSLIEDYGISPEKIIPVGAGPNLNELPSIQSKKYDGKTILFVGIEFLRKGGHILLEAFKKVKRDIKEARLIIVGGNPAIREEGVEVRGRVSEQELKELYCKSSIFVLPTLREPFGISFLEAMAYKLPCIGTNIEAIPEIIEDGKTGFLVPPGDVESLSEKMLLLLKDKELMSRMGEEGYKRIRDNFTWDRVADLIMTKFRESSVKSL